jgi:CHAD domain-containing protein
MTHTDTIHAIKSRFEKIQATFDVAIAYLDAEDIQAFRSEVKKLRAFLQLVSPREKLKLPRRLHQFYRIAGEIRNLQLQEQRIRDAFLNKGSLPQSYLTLLAIEAAKHIRRARKLAVDELSIAAEQQRVLQVLPNRLARESVRAFSLDSVQRLQTIGNQVQPVGNDALHGLRKCLKGLFYNHSYIKKEAAEILPFPAAATKNTFAALIDLLGQYQDIRTGLVLLRPCYIDQVADAAEKSSLEAVRTQWEDDKATLKHRILSSQLPMLHHAGVPTWEKKWGNAPMDVSQRFL